MIDWQSYYEWLGGQCGGEISISYPNIRIWKCACGYENATVERERPRCLNPKCNIIVFKKPYKENS
jgi:hypothetical protein